MQQALAARGWMPRERASVSALFLLNGYLVGNWAPKIPVFKAALGIDEAMLGLLILVLGAGSLVLMPMVGAVIARDGSQRISRATALGLTPMLLLVTLAPNLPIAAVALFLLGGMIGGMDVAMNANAVAVERGMRRAIMSSCHGFWSLGGLIGAASGGLLLAWLGSIGHATVVTLVCLAVLAWSWRGLLSDRPEAEAAKTPLRLPRTVLPWLIGLVALFCMIPEGAVLDWSALYLQQNFGASIATSGLPFAAFSATMAVMRFSGDPIRDWLGAKLALRVSTVVAMAGLLAAGVAPTAGIAIAGFAFAGLGIANMVPIVFSAAGNMPGLPAGIGLSIVTFMGYSGMLFAPSLIGFLAEHVGLAAVFTALPALSILVLVMSHHAVHADLRKTDLVGAPG